MSWFKKKEPGTKTKDKRQKMRDERWLYRVLKFAYDIVFKFLNL